MVLPIIGRGFAGGVISLVIRLREKIPGSTTDAFVDPNGLSISILSPLGIAVVTGDPFEYVSQGVYTYPWNTSGLSPGNYQVTATVVTNLQNQTSVPFKGVVVLN